MAVKWNNGPPPSIGWWPASASKNRDALRWWNGQYWSKLVIGIAGQKPDDISRNARQKAVFQHCVQWTSRPKSWPKRSHT